MVWPSVNHETLDWVSSAEVREAMSRRAKERMLKQYESALVPRIAEVSLNLSTDTFAHLEQVALQVTRFDAEQSNAILPFTALLLRSESFASSRIENLSSSARKIFEAEIEEYAGTKNAQLILANTRQMQEATKEPRVSVDGLLDMHRVLLEESAPEIAGSSAPKQCGSVARIFIPRVRCSCHRSTSIYQRSWQTSRSSVSAGIFLLSPMRRSRTHSWRPFTLSRMETGALDAH